MILRRSHPNDKLIVVSREIIIQNELGLHARPAAEFVRVANGFRAEITLIKGEQRFSASSLIDVLRANLDRGATAMLEARGAEACMKWMVPSAARNARPTCEVARSEVCRPSRETMPIMSPLRSRDSIAATRPLGIS